MGVETTPPMVAPFSTQRQEHLKHFDDSVNAVSFGFVATAILISMFLLLAIFERFFKQRSNESRDQTPVDLEDQVDFVGKFENPSPKIYGTGVLVLMPGEKVPTFIALPAPCGPEPISWPFQHYNPGLHL
ncbi:PREDICTED: uncharacterized protein At5g65660-like [Lupinus angustifolius]|uniref:uncharacterized protein At5g65660-like n=1 Tax=Lupinus angustifolius TaxID=3871 RepID=UPI00092F695C|nr:PREDICTED: uncharacterized protein At5g65660-like [Lupinus angustifolius]